MRERQERDEVMVGKLRAVFGELREERLALGQKEGGMVGGFEGKLGAVERELEALEGIVRSR